MIDETSNLAKSCLQTKIRSGGSYKKERLTDGKPLLNDI
jgi:hypothetical protein